MNKFIFCVILFGLSMPTYAAKWIYVASHSDILAVENNNDLKKQILEEPQLVQIEFNSAKELPAEFHVLSKLIYENDNRNKVKLVLSTTQDNKLFGGYFLLFGEENDGDDFGYTYGTAVGLEFLDKKGQRFKLVSNSNLYTKRLAQTDITPKGNLYYQHFTNERMIKIITDNMAKGKVLFYEASVGWTQLNSENPNQFLSPVVLQNYMHQIKGGAGFNNIPDGNAVRQGIDIYAYLGLQNELFNEHSDISVIVRAKSGAEYGHQLNSTEFKTSLSAQARVKLGAKTQGQFSLNNTYSAHKYGNLNTIKLEAGIIRPNFAVSTGISYYQGEANNYVNYNLPNNKRGGIDPIVDLTLKINLNRSKK